MNHPSLALCIPAYRAEHHLTHLLETAQQQNPLFDEIIVCVDASPDRTADIARGWGAQVLINDETVGCSASKNRALAAATADWIHFHDADDILLPNFTEEAHRWISSADAPDVVVMGFEYRDKATNKLLAIGLVDDSSLSSDPVAFTIRHKVPNFGLYRRDALVRLGGYDCDSEVLFNEDVAFHTKLALAGLRFRASSTVTSINWRHRDSMSGTNPVRCHLAHAAVMRKVAKRAKSDHAELIASNLWMAAQGLAMYGEWNNVDAVLDEASRIFPSVPSGQPRDFALLCRILPWPLAFRTREQLIRWLKPGLRRITQAASE